MNKRILHLLALLLFLGQMSTAQNNSLNFDGTNDFVQTTSPGITGNAARTVEAWIKTSWTGTQRIIVDWGVMSPNGSRYTFAMNNGGIRIEVGGNGVTGTIIGDGTWHHVAATYDNSLATNKHKLFVDGMMVAGSNLTVAANTAAGNIIIGRRNDGVNFWQGNIDDVRVWNVARTAADIAANMNTELTGTEANLIFYAKMDDDMASCDVVDCSPGQNHGTRIGGTLFSSDVPAGVTDADCAICMTNCNISTCSIAAITVSNISACNDNGTDMDPSDDTFTADVTVDFMGEPGTGTLDLSGDGTASVAVGSLTNCSHVFTGVVMSADGGTIDLTATFSANGGCTLNNSNAGIAPASCSNAIPPAGCSISDITAVNISACNNNGTPGISSDDTFTADVTVTFANAPATGTLNLSGDAVASVLVGSIGATSHTFSGLTMSANGTPIALTASFSADAACTLSDSNTGQAPSQCSVVMPPGSIPTMSEWGLILFALIIFTFSVVMGTQQQQRLALGGNFSADTRQSIPFDKALFYKVLPMVYLGIVVAFSSAIALFGYEMTTADIPGSLISGLVVTYLVHYVLGSSKPNK